MVTKRQGPHRKGFKSEIAFPTKQAAQEIPVRGTGPRCRVEYGLVDGPWSMLKIMHVEREDGEDTEEFICAMPRCYAAPLTLLNKRLAYFDAQRRPDGVSLTRARDERPSLRQVDRLEFTYLWSVRQHFLQAVLDMNHSAALDEQWRCPELHGFVYRTYHHFGHTTAQRERYWRAELDAGRAPYATPDIDKMGTSRRASTLRRSALKR
ncbi:hypothetical protein BC834DRAFT_76935 [Gloeopeniophorella convolvens]|nr:hypothetical protein BC834DRAFT_76935 [Gloeopeniophorella convolvens]